MDGHVVAGAVISKGTVGAIDLSPPGQKVCKGKLYYRTEKYDHNNPAFAKTSEGNIVAMYTKYK